MPSPWVRMSMATWRKELASQSAYLEADSSVGSEVRQVVTHLISGFRLPERF